MPTREQIARIIEPDGFKVLQDYIEYSHDPNLGMAFIRIEEDGSEWYEPFFGWAALAKGLLYNKHWQAVAQAWDKADKIIELFQSPYTDQEQIDDLEMLDEDDGLNLYRRLLKNYMGE